MTVNLLADVADVDVDDVTTVGRVVVVHDEAVDAELASISPTFYEQLFRTKVICAAFMCLQIGFVIFLAKGFWRKAAHKLLVKLTTGIISSTLQK